jgi:outer membrane protein assembly factor BamB
MPPLNLDRSMTRCCIVGLLFLTSIGCGRRRVDPVVEVRAVATEAASADEASAATLGRDDWSGWRGSNSDGIATGPAIPTKWSETENVTWKVEIPGRGHSSPIVIGEKIYLETADEKDETQSVLCLNRADGSRLWQTTLHQGQLDRALHKENTQASSTLACDGEHLYALFLNAGHIWASALDLDGHEVWKKEVGGFDSKFGYASSPALYKSLVLIAADHQQGGFIAALNRSSGDVAWRKKRPAKSSYASPRVISMGGKDQMILGGCSELCSYDPSTGDQLWHTKGTAEAGVGTAVIDGDLIFASGGYPEKNTLAVDASGKKVWQQNVKSYVPSMLTYEGYLYMTPDDGIFRCYEAKSGDEKWTKRVGGNFRSSPVLSGGHIFTTDMSGKTIVFKASPESCEIVAENPLGTEGFASPAISRGQLFLRVADNLKGSRRDWVYCIGQPITGQ